MDNAHSLACRRIAHEMFGPEHIRVHKTWQEVADAMHYHGKWEDLLAAAKWYEDGTCTTYGYTFRTA